MEALRASPRRPTQKPRGRLRRRRPTQPFRGRRRSPAADTDMPVSTHTRTPCFAKLALFFFPVFVEALRTPPSDTAPRRLTQKPRGRLRRRRRTQPFRGRRRSPAADTDMPVSTHTHTPCFAKLALFFFPVFVEALRTPPSDTAPRRPTQKPRGQHRHARFDTQTLVC